LSRVSRVDPRQWKRKWEAIKSLFDIDAGRVTNVDLQAELGRANAKAVVKRAAASLGGQTTQFRYSLTGFKGHPFRAKKSFQNNGGPQANAQHSYNYNKEEEKRSDEPRPETGSSSLEKASKKEEVVSTSPPSPTPSEPAEGSSTLDVALASLGKAIRERRGCE
jgi:hypothetical protein